MSEGWYDYAHIQVNCVNGKWVGFMITEYNDGKLSIIGLVINDYRFGWSEDYRHDGSIGTEFSGFYENDVKI